MIANLVTASRLVLAIPLFLCLIAGNDAARWAALAILALAGLTDVVDGRIARALNQVSPLGAMLYLVADRALTATLAVGLIAGGDLQGPWGAAALVLLGRDLAVASFGEASKGRAKFPVTALERVKIALQFAGFGLLVAPVLAAWQHDVGRWTLAGSAALALFTLVGYGRRAVVALREP
jgi:phosphatidylglycerophosphate synthase